MTGSPNQKQGNTGSSFSDIKDVAIYILDLSQGEFLYIGSPILELTGYLPNFFMENGLDALFEILGEDDFSRIKEKYSASFWKPRETDPKQPEIFSDVFKVRRKEGDYIWMENTIVILNYAKDQTPKKALGYFKRINPDYVVNFKDRINSLRRIILNSTPPHGIAQISSLKNWSENKVSAFHKDSLLQVAFQGVLNFKLTNREREILKYIADGFSAREIASMLFISESTVVTHRRHLLQKFEVKNVAELIKVASKYFHFN